ncbi:MAG: PorT family protein [Pyrinomonadaceae bacterium]|nr:PorT family protein [Sphingobacteriaceae bacterium]
MKYKFFTVILFLIPFLSNAQEAEKSIQLGFTLAPNVAWLQNIDSNSSYSSDGSQPGLAYGVLADLSFAKNYFFSTAFTVTTVNSKATLSSGTTKTSEKYKLQYIEIPLTLKLKSNASNTARFYGQFGLGTGINISAKKDIASTTTTSGKNISIGSDINTFRLSLIAGGGAEWVASKNLHVLTGVTWNNGFTNMSNKVSNGRNSYVALNLGVYF